MKKILKNVVEGEEKTLSVIRREIGINTVSPDIKKGIIFHAEKLPNGMFKYFLGNDEKRYFISGQDLNVELRNLAHELFYTYFDQVKSVEFKFSKDIDIEDFVAVMEDLFYDAVENL